MAIKIHMLYTVQNVYKHVDNVDNLLAKELFSNIYNVSGPHSYQQVTLCTIFKQKVLDFVESREIFARSAEFPDLFLKISGGDAEVIGLTGCINICKDYVVCKCQSLCKFRKQRTSGSGFLWRGAADELAGSKRPGCIRKRAGEAS